MLACSRAPHLLRYLIENSLFDLKSDTGIPRYLCAYNDRIAILSHRLIFGGKTYDRAHYPHLFHTLT